MSLSQLTKKEKQVFFNIVKSPDFTDKQLSDSLGIKRSTVTAIRNRLNAEGFYSNIIIPNLPAIGCRLLGITYGKYNPLTPQEERMKAKTFGEGIKHPELVFARSSDTEFIRIYVAEHLADMRSVQDKMYMDYEAHGFIEDIRSIYYPFEMCQITSLFNFVPCIGRMLGVDMADESYNNYIFNGYTKPIELTNAEKVVLDAIVKSPEANIMELSKITNKTRSTVSKIKSELVERKMIQTVCLPALEKLGCELMVFLHTRFNPKSPMETRKDDMKHVMKTASHVFKVSGDIESAGIMIPKNYTDFIASYNNMIGLYREKNYISENPYSLLFSVEKIKSRKLDFSAITHKMLFER